MRIFEFPIDLVVRPMMWEVWNIAKAAGHQLPEEVVEGMIHVDPTDTFFKPSMQQDVEKVRKTYNFQPLYSSKTDISEREIILSSRTSWENHFEKRSDWECRHRI